MRAYLELVRLPNVFTAMADVMLGFLLTHADLRPVWTFALLLASSSLLYSAGMVLNDLLDVMIDMRERPHRPLPSGRVHLRIAKKLGLGLLAGGVLLGWAASIVASLQGGQWQWRSGPAATLLAAAIIAYDRYLKRTALGPVAMGTCRLLNVLLGASAADAVYSTIWHPMVLLVALGVGVYIAGVTWFARTEARESHRVQLAAALPVMATGIALLAWFPSWADENLARISFPQAALDIGGRWYFLWIALAALILWRCAWAVAEPSSVRVQTAVKHCILSLIVLDAAACFAVRGVFWATMILVLIAPAVFLSRWIYST